MRALDNIVLTCTIDNLIRARFSSKKVFIVLDLRSYHESDSLKHRFELKGPILCLKTLWKTPFSRKLRNKPVLRFYEKKSSTLLSVVWAEESKNGLSFEIRPSYDGVPTRSQLVTHGQSSCSRVARYLAILIRFCL